MVFTDTSGISIHDFSRYMNLKGFCIREDFPNKDLIVFRKKMDDHFFDIVIPSDDSFLDYEQRLYESIERIGKIEKKSVSDIVEEIVKPNADKLLIRVISDISEDGSIPLSYAANFVTSLRELVIAAACAEENPEPYYNRALKRAVEYADTIKFGQTQKGSFVATVESYIPYSGFDHSEQQSDQEVEQIPFERRVVQRIQLGIAQVEEALLKGNVGRVIESGYKSGLTANMCDAILKFKTDNRNMKLEYKVNWSPVVPAPKQIPDRVILERNGFELMKTLSSKYRGAMESTRKTICGYVIGLSAADMDEENEYAQRVVTVKPEDEASGIKRVKLYLGLEDYKKACDAHRDSLKIEVEGILERDGKQWRLTQASEFKLSQ